MFWGLENEEEMKLTGMISLVIGVFLVLLIILAMQGLLAGDWNTVGERVAPLILMLAVFGFVAASIVYFLRK